MIYLALLLIDSLEVTDSKCGDRDLRFFFGKLLFTSGSKLKTTIFIVVFPLKTGFSQLKL